MPVVQVLWVGAAIFPHDKVTMLMLYEVENVKFCTFPLHSVSSSELQFFRYVILFHVSFLTPSSKPVFMPGGQGHFRTRTGSLGTTSQWKKATGAGSAKQVQGKVRLTGSSKLSPAQNRDNMDMNRLSELSNTRPCDLGSVTLFSGVQCRLSEE